MKNKIALNITLTSVLLFILVIPFLMNYSLSVEGTPYWLFGFIFLALFIYFFADFYHDQRNYFKIKSVFLWIVVILVLGSAFGAAVARRHKVSPTFEVHDIILQQEAAVNYLLQGKNPYQETYFGTLLEDWHYSDTEVNPALYHFVMEPFYLLFAVPFYLISIPVLGFYDTRIVLYFLFAMLLIFGWKIVSEREKKLLFVTLLAFNPAILPYILEGRSDIFMFAFFFAGMYFLYKGKLSIAGIFVALAFAVKQSIWPFLPFYLAYLYFREKGSILERIKFVLSKSLAFIITFLIVILPFAVWNLEAFLESTIFYLSGNSVNSYPIAGYGFGMVLNKIGIITNLHDVYPFIIWQVLFSFPLFCILIIKFGKEPSVKNAILSYGLFLFVFWYFSRYFNNSHIGYLSTVFLCAYFFPEKTNEPES